jgi:hypothetical protein
MALQVLTLSGGVLFIIASRSVCLESVQKNLNFNFIHFQRDSKMAKYAYDIMGLSIFATVIATIAGFLVEIFIGSTFILALIVYSTLTIYSYVFHRALLLENELKEYLSNPVIHDQMSNQQIGFTVSEENKELSDKVVFYNFMRAGIFNT